MASRLAMGNNFNFALVNYNTINLPGRRRVALCFAYMVNFSLAKRGPYIRYLLYLYCRQSSTDVYMVWNKTWHPGQSNKCRKLWRFFQHAKILLASIPGITGNFRRQWEWKKSLQFCIKSFAFPREHKESQTVSCKRTFFLPNLI